MPAPRSLAIGIRHPEPAHLVRLVLGASVSAALVALAIAGSVLAATPPGTTGGGSEPEISPFGWVMPLVGTLAALAVAIGIVVGLAVVVARIGGPAGSRSRGSRSRASLAVALVFGLGAAIAGVVIGRAIAYVGSLGGFHFIDSTILSALVGLVVVGLVAIGLVALTIRHGHVTRTIGTMLASAALLAVGAFGGSATAAATGGLYREPVVLQASGETHVALETGPLPFVARDGGKATCRSVPDSRTVDEITALDLGELGHGTLRAMLRVRPTTAGPSSAEFFIDGGDLAEGSDQPSWRGSILVTTTSGDQAAGRLAFDGLVLISDTGKPDPATGASTSAVGGWPATISGELSWTCQPW